MRPKPPGEEERDIPPLLARIANFGLLRYLQGALTLLAVFLLAFAAMMLTLAWHLGPEVVVRHTEYAKLSGRAEARIVESWLALDVDIPTIRHADYWRASTRASPCIVVEMQGEWSDARVRAFCGNQFVFSESYEVPFLNELAPGVPFAWSRDERGFAVPQIRMSRAAFDWLGSHPIDTFMHRAWPAKSALDWLKLELDRPVDAAIAGWMAPAPALSVVYDPANPGVLLPEGLVRSRQAIAPSWVFSFLVAAFGLGLWVGGMLLLPATWSFNTVGRVALIVIPLVALPWWADYMPRALRFFNAEVGEFASDLMGYVDPLDRFAAVTPGEALEAGGERLSWPVGGGPYADTFGRLQFARPATVPPSADAALEMLAASATAQVRALGEGERIALFDDLRRDKLRDLMEAGLIMLPAAREALVDADSPPSVRRAARRFLTDWVIAPTLTIDPHLPAYDARLGLVRSLADVPVPEIANLVPHLAPRK